MNILWIGVAAFLGGIVSGVLGWLDSGEAFEIRKFSATIVRALVAGIVFAIGYHYANGLSPIDLGLAFVGGSGIDVLGNRISGSIKAGLKK
ncbi:hypothetical protein KKF82_08270 [Patescibacteria group bacterium]|nr:hypothetical protein [Patescibacteria group bacterium]